MATAPTPVPTLIPMVCSRVRLIPDEIGAAVCDSICADADVEVWRAGLDCLGGDCVAVIRVDGNKPLLVVILVMMSTVSELEVVDLVLETVIEDDSATRVAVIVACVLGMALGLPAHIEYALVATATTFSSAFLDPNFRVSSSPLSFIPTHPSTVKIHCNAPSPTVNSVMLFVVQRQSKVGLMPHFPNAKLKSRNDVKQSRAHNGMTLVRSVERVVFATMMGRACKMRSTRGRRAIVRKAVSRCQ